MTTKVFIDGAEGTTGLKIKDRLKNRSDIVLLDIDSKERKKLKARADKIYESDISILCLPDNGSIEIIDYLYLESAPQTYKIIDTSTAHRVDDGWVYGMPELSEAQKGKIKNADRVAVPGCHASGYILLTKPLLEAGVINKEDVLSCTSITGYSGGGKQMIAEYEGKRKAPVAYALEQNHKHLPEMVKMSGLSNPPVFSPIIGDYYSGMLFSITILNAGSIESIKKIYEEYYKTSFLIDVKENNESKLNADELRGKDNLEIFVQGNSNRALVMARYDNLGKGASGAAIQCLNLMIGNKTNEEDGLSW